MIKLLIFFIIKIIIIMYFIFLHVCMYIILVWQYYCYLNIILIELLIRKIPLSPNLQNKNIYNDLN